MRSQANRSLLQAFLALSVTAMAINGCHDSQSNSDGGQNDADASEEQDPCEAAAPLWNEIWHISRVELGEAGATPTNNLMDVWGSGPNDIYAVGFAGTIYHYSKGNDGEVAWRKMESGTGINLTGVWGYVLVDDEGNVTRTDVFAVGEGGTILRYDGTAWTIQRVINDPDPANPRPQVVLDNFNDVWGIPAQGPDPLQHHPEVIAVGSNGLIVRYDGEKNEFNEMRTQDPYSLRYVRFSPERLGGVFGAGGLNNPLFVAVGNNGAILELSGNSWNVNQNFSPPGAFITHLTGVWGPSRNEIFAVGLDGTVLTRDSGGTWHILKKENEDFMLQPVYLRGFWGFTQNHCGELPESPDGGVDPDSPRGNTSWALFVGWDGTVLAGHEGIICPLEVPTANRLEAIWGTAPRSDAQRAVDNGEEAPTEWECDPIQVYVVGVNGTLLRLSNPDGR